MNITRTRLMALCVMIALVSTAVLGFGHTTQAQSTSRTGTNWQAFYWNNNNFTGSPAASRYDAAINFNWDFASPIPGTINPDNFSIRWYNTLNCTAGTYNFRGGADDGIRIAIDGVKIIDRFTAAGGFVMTSANVTLTQGTHNIVVDYFEAAGQAGVLVDWTSTTGGNCDTIVPSSGTFTGTGTPFATTVFGPTATPVPPPVRAVIIADIVNVRSAASTDSDIIQIVYKGEDFRVVAQNGLNTWFLIDLGGGRTGWVWRTGLIYLYNGDHTKLPFIQGSVSAVKPAPVPQDVQAYARFMVFVRSLPSTRNSEKLGVINQGEYFKVIKRAARNRAWVFVDFNGLQGWVFLPNIRIVQGFVGLLPIGN